MLGFETPHSPKFTIGIRSKDGFALTPPSHNHFLVDKAWVIFFCCWPATSSQVVLWLWVSARVSLKWAWCAWRITAVRIKLCVTVRGNPQNKIQESRNHPPLCPHSFWSFQTSQAPSWLVDYADPFPRKHSSYLAVAGPSHHIGVGSDVFFF